MPRLGRFPTGDPRVGEPLSAPASLRIQLSQGPTEGEPQTGGLLFPHEGTCVPLTGVPPPGEQPAPWGHTPHGRPPVAQPRIPACQGAGAGAQGGSTALALGEQRALCPTGKTDSRGSLLAGQSRVKRVKGEEGRGLPAARNLSLPALREPARASGGRRGQKAQQRGTWHPRLSWRRHRPHRRTRAGHAAAG